MSSEKTEPPSEEKIRKAREKGNVAQRKNLIETVSLITMVTTIVIILPRISIQMVTVFETAMVGITVDFDTALSTLISPIKSVFLFGVITSIFAALGGLFLGLVFNKFNFAAQAISPKFEKFNPVTGVKNLFSLSTLNNFFRMLVIFTLISLSTYLIISADFNSGIASSICGLRCIAEVVSAPFLKLIISIFSILIIMAVLDFKIQNALYTKNNKMDHNEVKQENKELSGNPIIKGAQRSAANDILHSPSLNDATHFVHSEDTLVVMMRESDDPDFPPFVIMNTQGDHVGELVAKLKAKNIKSLKSEKLALESHKKFKPDHYVSSESAGLIYRIMEQLGEV